MIVCRTCLSKNDLAPIFSEHDSFSFSSTELFLVTGLEICRNDGLSQEICRTCVKLVGNALKLRQQSSKADATLRRRAITENLIKLEANSLDVGDCKEICKISKSIKLLETLDNDIYNTIDCDLLIDPSLKHNQILKKCKEEKLPIDPGSFEPDTSSIDIKIKTDMSENKSNKNIKNTVCQTDSLKEQFPKKRNRSARKKYPKRCPLRIEDLESSGSDREGSEVKIEDYESSDSFDVDMNLISEEINLKPSAKNNMLHYKNEDKKYLAYYRCVKKKEINQKETRKTLTKETEKKYLSLAVTPYDKNGPIQCCVCYSTVGSFNSFKTHARTHFEPQFSCETCGKKFTSNSLMRYHQQRMHGRTKRLGCPYCPFRSVDRQTLRNHERAEHTGERPYTCNECGVSFRMRNNLIQHMRKHFGVKNMQCERCPAMFRSRSELWGHQTKVHFMTYNYYCYLCPESYKGPGPVKKHLLNVHGVPEEQQLKIKCVKTRKIREDRPDQTTIQNPT